MTETPFKNIIEKLLQDYNAWYIKYWAGSKFTKEGIPDILACINGTFYGMELKGDGGHPSLLQLIKLRKIREAGGIGLLLYPNDLTKFQEFIEGTTDDRWYSENIKLQLDWFNRLMN